MVEKPAWAPRRGEVCGSATTTVQVVAMPVALGDATARGAVSLPVVEVEVCGMHERSMRAAEARGDLEGLLSRWGVA